jgi:ornithine carbamoyltransferase
MASTGLSSKDFLSVLDLDGKELLSLLDLATRLKAERRLGPNAPTANALAAFHVAMLFEKPSLRTRSTFEMAVRELGGDCLHVPAEMIDGAREPLEDVARNLERWVHALVVRTFAQKKAEALATATTTLHVVNALTDEEHPCQALADVMTLREHWHGWQGRTLAYVGDGNNVAASLCHACSMVGVSVRVASPRGHELPAHVVEQSARVARDGARVACLTDPFDAVAGADAVYTDVWTSMGQEKEARSRQETFAPYQVTPRLMSAAGPKAVFMHCLPAHRGEEVTTDVLESGASIVFDQAENRLHAQKALLLMLLA